MPDSPSAQIGAVITALICLFAVLKGDLPERAGGILFMAAWIGTLMLSSDTQTSGIRYGTFVMDAIATFGYAAIAWRSRRTWAIWATAFAALAVASHVAYALDARIHMYAYLTADIVASYGVLLALALGTWRSWRGRS